MDESEREEFEAQKERWVAEGSQELIYGNRPDWMDFQIGEKGLSPHFFAKAQLGGFLRRKTTMQTKVGVDGRETDFMFIVMDTGSVYTYSADPVKNQTRNVVSCVLFGKVARLAERAIADMNAQMYSRPWIMVEGVLESVFEKVDRKDPSKGMKVTGRQRVRVTSFYCPPVPKPTRIRPEFREKDEPEDYGIQV